jgi:pimeloyl-ACP methyl ester carboxylesterase
MFRHLERNLAIKREWAALRGSVRTQQPTDLPIVVFVYAGESGREQLVDYFVLAGPGPYSFTVPAGTYRLAAFEDLNRDFTYEPGVDASALLDGGKPVAVLGGATLSGLDIEIGDANREPIPFAFSSADRDRTGERALPAFHLGEITRIDDPRFSQENARLGLWQPVDFLSRVGAGVYFLEPYDPRKIPVLFVHGAVGHPGNFARLIAGLDRNHFQPWLVYYPSASNLDNTAQSIDRWVQYLYVRYHYPRMVVVAHSMGGLVARAFINRVIAAGDGRAEGLRLFITISTPWDGHSAAQRGVSQAPVVAPSWYDMAPGSPFLRSLLEPPLPSTLGYDLFFSYAGGSRWTCAANDGVVTLASQLLPRAQTEARMMHGFDETHRTILRSADLSAMVHEQLAPLAAEQVESSASAGSSLSYFSSWPPIAPGRHRLHERETRHTFNRHQAPPGISPRSALELRRQQPFHP